VAYGTDVEVGLGALESASCHLSYLSRSYILFRSKRE